MNIATMKMWFELLQDKSGSAYYTDSEISLFINRAQIDFVEKLLSGDGEQELNIESSQDTIQSIAPLIYELPYLTMNSSGVITKGAVQTALTNLVADGILWRPLAIGWELGKSKLPIKYTRHNDRWEFETNYFKKPSTKSPKVRETYNSYVFSPATLAARIYFTVLKYPKTVDITNTIDSDLPDNTHNRIIATALEFAGVGSRDAMLTQLLQLQNGQK